MPSWSLQFSGGNGHNIKNGSLRYKFGTENSMGVGSEHWEVRRVVGVRLSEEVTSQLTLGR